jgi:hypothetical protein
MAEFYCNSMQELGNVYNLLPLELHKDIGITNSEELRHKAIVDEISWRLATILGDVKCNRTDQIIRAQVKKTSTEALKFSNLSPYNPGSQSKPRRISNQLAYNQDRIIQHTTSYVTFRK